MAAISSFLLDNDQNVEKAKAWNVNYPSGPLIMSTCIFYQLFPKVEPSSTFQELSNDRKVDLRLLWKYHSRCHQLLISQHSHLRLYIRRRRTKQTKVGITEREESIRKLLQLERVLGMPQLLLSDPLCACATRMGLFLFCGTCL